MKEEFLQYIWKQQLFNQQALRTDDGEELKVLQPGFWNQLSGPDFLDARIEIGSTLWAGSIEIHMLTSEWFAHHHHQDKNYDNVVLHVVYDHDAQSQRAPNIPVFTLRDRIDPRLVDAYTRLTTEKETIACKAHLPAVNGIVWRQWKDRLLVQRLERKSEDIEWVFQRCNQDWLQCFYVLFAGYLGQNQNKLPFQQTAFNLPIKTLLKVADQPEVIRAMIYGTAGLLDQVSDSERANLTSQFEFHQSKHALKVIETPWRFGKIRPEAAPKRRLQVLAQLAPYLPILQAAAIHDNLKDWIQIAQAALRKEGPHLSEQLLHILFINAVVPYAFYFAQRTGNDRLRDVALDAMSGLKPEKNRISKAWKSVGVDLDSANDSQALIELFTRFCDQKKCVLCTIGQSIIRKTI